MKIMGRLLAYFRPKIETVPNAIDVIGDPYPLILVPFNGKEIFVRIKELNQVQIQACGNFSVIQTHEDKERGKDQKTLGESVQYAKLVSTIVKKALVKPKYEDFISLYDRHGALDKARETLSRLRERLATVPEVDDQGNETKEMQELENEMNAEEAFYDLVLPTDFTSVIVPYALGTIKSDVDEITADLLFDWACAGKRGNKDPADYANGEFTAFMKWDINNRAWEIYNERMQAQKNMVG